MKSAIEQSIKEKIKALAKERGITFAEVWRNLILERFLTRLALSSFRNKFVLKGGTLLAKYIQLDRETQDLDFFIQRLSNTEASLKTALHTICEINIPDSFTFEVVKVKILDHSQLAYTGAEITLQALFGGTKTVMRMDLGFGDRVDPIEYPISLTASSKGPLFETSISLYCYPKEFIFAEKLETVVYRGKANTRMKDFHDLYSLVQLNVLNSLLAKHAIKLVFHHRKTPLDTLPLAFSQDALDLLQKNWTLYQRKIKPRKGVLELPESIKDVISALNDWLRENPL